ncbi:MAG: hypothetical protein V4727_11405 [Verrucomicrobiota bacterium]
MIKKILSLFGAKKAPEPPEHDEEAASQWYDEKSAYMEAVLGKEHDMVMHAIIPYAVGGGLDLYYYPNGIEGVGIATKEVSDLPDQGSSNKQFDQYELVMFTRHQLNLDIAKDKSTAFGKAHSNINSILNCIAPYSAQATLNHNETCEFPAEMEGLGGKCLIFQAYGWTGETKIRALGSDRGVSIRDAICEEKYYRNSDRTIQRSGSFSLFRLGSRASCVT